MFFAGIAGTANCVCGAAVVAGDGTVSVYDWTVGRLGAIGGCGTDIGLCDADVGYPI